MAKEYKRYRIAQYILFVLSIISCLIPAVVAAFRVAPSVKSTESKIALGGVAVFFCGVIALIVLRNLVKKLIAKMPYTLAVLITVGILLIFMLLIEKIVDDAIVILIVGVVGAGVGLLFELASMWCKVRADEIKDIYKMRRAQDE
jgi:Na+/melibiose symporter-like transporter